MGNLRGKNFGRQIKNAMCRLSAFGQRRYGTDSKLTHSLALGVKREMYLKDFARFLEKKNINEGKLNLFFREEYLSEFLNERLQNLSPKTSLDYVTGFNSMLSGLEQTKVNISPNAHSVLKEFTSDYRQEFNQVKGSFETGRAVSDTKSFLNDLSEIRESSSILAELQLQTGLRASEALEVTKNFIDYYNPTTSELIGIKGKGGQEYFAKTISQELAYKLYNLPEVPKYSSYYENLKELGHKTHDLRITFAKNYYQELRQNGFSNREALKMTSKELNHHRESITSYYLARA